MQSSVALGGVPERAVDGSTSNFFTPETCTMTESERAPWWYVNLLEPYMVQLVRLDFGKACCGKTSPVTCNFGHSINGRGSLTGNGKPATIVVRVGNNRPDLGVNAICNRFTGFIEEGRPLFLPCNPPMPGAFVSVHLEGSPGNPLSICEAFVYTDQVSSLTDDLTHQVTDLSSDRPCPSRGARNSAIRSPAVRPRTTESVTCSTTLIRSISMKLVSFAKLAADRSSTRPILLCRASSAGNCGGATRKFSIVDTCRRRLFMKFYLTVVTTPTVSTGWAPAVTLRIGPTGDGCRVVK